MKRKSIYKFYKLLLQAGALSAFLMPIGALANTVNSANDGAIGMGHMTMHPILSGDILFGYNLGNSDTFAGSKKTVLTPGAGATTPNKASEKLKLPSMGFGISVRPGMIVYQSNGWALAGEGSITAMIDPSKKTTKSYTDAVDGKYSTTVKTSVQTYDFDVGGTAYKSLNKRQAFVPGGVDFMGRLDVGLRLGRYKLNTTTSKPEDLTTNLTLKKSGTKIGFNVKIGAGVQYNINKNVSVHGLLIYDYGSITTKAALPVINADNKLVASEKVKLFKSGSLELAVGGTYIF